MAAEQERPSCYKTVAEICAALRIKTPANKTKKVKKGGGNFTYISWETTTRELDRIYGPFGWSTEPISFSADAGHGVYLAAIKLTVTAIDDVTGIIITKSVAGFGRGIAQASKEDREADPTATVATNLVTHDTAASAAGSDALSKASKLLGDAFGLFLYDKDDPANAGSSGGGYRGGNTTRQSSQPAQTEQPTAPQGARPNEQEHAALLSGGFPEHMIAAMPENVWRNKLAGLPRKAAS